MITHERTKSQIVYLLDKQPESILVVAPEGAGKRALTDEYIEKLGSDNEVQLYDFDAGSDFGIDNIRELWTELGRKPASKQHLRVIVINSAHRLQHEAQTALLKSIEEPPKQTRIMLLATDEEKILSTIRSRSYVLRVSHPSLEDYKATYPLVDSSKIEQYYALSGGMPRLMEDLVNSNDEYVDTYVSLAKQFLGYSINERLCNVESLLKNKDIQLDLFLEYLMRLCRSALLQNIRSGRDTSTLWQKKTNIALQALDALRSRGNPKLVLSYIALNL